MRLFALICLVWCLGAPSFAVEPSEMLADPVLEARARDISKGLRCVVCRNQNIDDSNAGIARDMRLALRERLVAGDSNEQAQQFIVARYGTYVLLNPPVTPVTILLWAGPAILLVVTALGFARRFRGKTQPEPVQPLGAQERELVEELLARVDTK